MFGCLRRLGCLAILAIAAIAAYVLRDRWLPMVTGSAAEPAYEWEQVSPDDLGRARRTVGTLESKRGAVFANLSAAEAAALVLDESQRRLPGVVHGGDATIVGRSITMRTTVDLSELPQLDGVRDAIGLTDARQNVTLTGEIDVLAPGIAQFRVQRMKIGDVVVPQGMVPGFISRIDRGTRPANAASDAIVFPLPPFVGDVRVGKGSVTLYKNVK